MTTPDSLPSNELVEARRLLHEMLAIHHAGYDLLQELDISEARIQEMHEYAEEALCGDIEKFFQAHPQD